MPATKRWAPDRSSVGVGLVVPVAVCRDEPQRNEGSRYRGDQDDEERDDAAPAVRPRDCGAAERARHDDTRKLAAADAEAQREEAGGEQRSLRRDRLGSLGGTIAGRPRVD